MQRSEVEFAQGKLAQLKEFLQLDILADWGNGEDEWKSGT